MKQQGAITIGKFEPGCINEDAVLARPGLIAVSDGAGGGGLFAERWSRYLLAHLPDTPIDSAEALDGWIESIWEPFYNRCEQDAQQLGGLSLDKFYDEGSFATLVAVWRTAANRCQWMSYGDSVAFHYNKRTHQLEHSFSRLADFDNPPYLINCKDELRKEGFRCGTFETDADSILFVASDALAHYLLMMYEVEHLDLFAAEWEEAMARHSKNENYMRAALSIPKHRFETKVLGKLLNSTGAPINFQRHLRSLLRRGLIAHDDYSVAYMRLANHPFPAPKGKKSR